MNNILIKSANLEQAENKDIDLINKYALRELSLDEVFIFKLTLCDNEIDRDIECFTIDTLNNLSNIFVGKTVISNHMPTMENQFARIYKTEIKTDETYNKQGECYIKLIAFCYMIKTNETYDLIKQIEAGIKKEVSVSFACSKIICSICGKNQKELACEHVKGQIYEDKLCYHKLCEVTDAYEVSFVAIPAQKKAGVTKNYTLSSTNKDVLNSISQKNNKETSAYQSLFSAFLKSLK